jgi:hypothetical protein
MISFDKWSIAHAGLAPAFLLFYITICAKNFKDCIYLFFIINILHDVDEILENYTEYSIEGLTSFIKIGRSKLDNKKGPPDMLGDILSCKIGTSIILLFVKFFGIYGYFNYFKNNNNLERWQYALYILPLLLLHIYSVTIIYKNVNIIFKNKSKYILPSSFIILCIVHLIFVNLTQQYNLKILSKYI